MANGSREPGRGPRAAAVVGEWVGGGGGLGAPTRLPWAMSHEPLTISNRLIHEFFDYILYVLSIQ